MTSWAVQALGQNLSYANDAALGMMMCSPHNVHETHAMEAAMIMKGTTSVLKNLAQRFLKALCAMLVSQSIFEC
jgi:hypothetical protein